MITAITGEAAFSDGLQVAPHSLFSDLLKTHPGHATSVRVRELPVEGWKQLVLGIHASDKGEFEVEAAMGPEHRVEGLFLSHHHSFYEARIPADSERRAFHEGVIATDLRGQHEFSWGHVFCRLDKKTNRDWLVLIYSPFSNIPMHKREVYKILTEHEKTA